MAFPVLSLQIYFQNPSAVNIVTHTHMSPQCPWLRCGPMPPGDWLLWNPTTGVKVTPKHSSHNKSFGKAVWHRPKNRHSTLLLNHTLEPVTFHSTHSDAYIVPFWNWELLRPALWNKQDKQLAAESSLTVQSQFPPLPMFTAEFGDQQPCNLSIHPPAPIHPAHLCQSSAVCAQAIKILHHSKRDPKQKEETVGARRGEKTTWEKRQKEEDKR